MRKLLMLAVAATLLAGTTGSSTASPTAYAHRFPDEGYQYGYRAGTNWLQNTQHTNCDIRKQWHGALTTRDNYEAQGDQGHADYWQGYADGLHWADNDDCSGPDCPCYGPNGTE